MATVNCKIDCLWNKGTLKEWDIALAYYYNLIKPTNLALERQLDNINPKYVKNMKVKEFYNFLHDKYFVWKYTAANRLATTKNSLKKSLQDDNMFELEEIHNRIFEYNPNDIEICLKNVQRIRGLGISGASGLLSLLFPKSFGTVDQFVIKNLLAIKTLKEHSQIEKMNPNNISLKDGFC